MPGEEIKVNRSFYNYNIEKDPLGSCKARMSWAILGVAAVYLCIAIRTFAVCWSGYNPSSDKKADDDEMPQIMVENPITRADIVDRNGAIIATSLPTVNLYAKPFKVKNKEEAAEKLSELIPDMLYEDTPN